MRQKFIYPLLLVMSLCIHLDMQALIVPAHDPAPFILPPSHGLNVELNRIFSNPNVLKNEEEFEKAGFKLLLNRTRGFLKIAKHPALPGYLFKLYLEASSGESMPLLQRRLVQRCKSASMIRERIQGGNFRYFTVPNKWLYKVPNTQLFVLIVQDMQLETREKSSRAWKTEITPAHLRELFHLCNDGFTSVSVAQNIPYTKLGTFSCIDTEFPRRVLNLRKVRKYLSKHMRLVWDHILLGKSEKYNSFTF